MTLRHWLAHLLGWNTGEVYVWWDRGNIMVGFRCDGCDTISGVHKVPDEILK
jgi:hypothetical protein